MKRRDHLPFPLLLSALLYFCFACEDEVKPQSCEAVLPEAKTACSNDGNMNCTHAVDDPDRSTIKEIELEQSNAPWIVAAWNSQQVSANDSTTFDYEFIEAQKAETALHLENSNLIQQSLMSSQKPKVNPRADEAWYKHLKNKIAAEHYFRSISPFNPANVPKEFNRSTTGTIQQSLQNQDTLTIKLRKEDNTVEDITANIVATGTYARFAVDQADTIADADIQELKRRFDERIAPKMHTYFGKPVDKNGHDFDGDGVVLLFFSSKISQLRADGVGFFDPVDLEDPNVNAKSNGRDMLYVVPPSSKNSIDSISGTLAHEYQHLINAIAKTSRGSSKEEVWLDEGLALFAEDLTGYGLDAQSAVISYLSAVNDTSLTGFGLIAKDETSADSPERRGMAFAFLRFLFERAGGLSIDEIPNQEAVNFVKDIVQNEQTDIEVLSAAITGLPVPSGKTGPRSLHDRLGDFYLALAVTGENYKNLSCNPEYSFEAPFINAETKQPQGITIRGIIKASEVIVADGPDIADFTKKGTNYENLTSPISVFGGELRRVPDLTILHRLRLIAPKETIVSDMRAVQASP